MCLTVPSSFTPAVTIGMLLEPCSAGSFLQKFTFFGSSSGEKGVGTIEWSPTNFDGLSTNECLGDDTVGGSSVVMGDCGNKDSEQFWSIVKAQS